MKNNYILLIVSLFLPVIAVGQVKKDSVMERTVVVEQNYNPIIGKAKRVNVLPELVNKKTQKKAMRYTFLNIPLSDMPRYAMNSFMTKQQPKKLPKFYLRLGGGDRSSIDLLGNINLSISERDNLNASLDIIGNKGVIGQPNYQWISKYYRANGNLNYSHRFDNISLWVNLKTNASIYNYIDSEYPNIYKDAVEYRKGDKKLGGAAINIGIDSKKEDSKIKYGMSLGYANEKEKFFGKPSSDGAAKYADANLSEGHLKLNGYFGYAFTDEHSIEVGGGVNALSYNINGFKSRTDFTVTPTYKYASGNIVASVGASIDISSGAESKGALLPKLSLAYTIADNYKAYALLRGNKMYNDILRRQEVCRYGKYTTQSKTTYVPINATLGIKGSIVEGMHFDLYAGYEKRLNELLIGDNREGIDIIAGQYSIINSYEYADIHTPYVGGELSYAYENYLGVNISGVYRKWVQDGEKDQDKDLLRYKGNTEVNASVFVKPYRGLFAEVGYHYVGRNDVKDISLASVNLQWQPAETFGYEVANIWKNARIYITINNILNNSFSYCRGYESIGITAFLGGIINF